MERRGRDLEADADSSHAPLSDLSGGGGSDGRIDRISLECCSRVFRERVQVSLGMGYL
jgi:hypothetical protein